EVHGVAEHVLAALDHRPGLQADAQPELAPAYRRQRVDGAEHRRGRGHRRVRAREERHHLVADGLHHPPARRLHRLAHQLQAARDRAGLCPRFFNPYHLAVEQHIRFCTAPDGVRLAYATSGKGPALVRAPHWLTHLEFDWRSPVHRPWLEGLNRDHLLVRFDPRGCGLSERDVADVSFETWVQDLEAVVDAAGLERFILFGASQGGPIAVDYAVRHPGRVAKLVLHGAYARGRLVRASTPRDEEEAE